MTASSSCELCTLCVVQTQEVLMRVCVYWGGCRYPTRWEGNSIVVLDQYIIKAPYQAENIVLIRDRDGTTDGLNRLTKVVRIYMVVCLSITNAFTHSCDF